MTTHNGGFAAVALQLRRARAHAVVREASSKPYAFKQAVDILLDEIEDELEQRPTGRRHIPDELWDALAALADRIGYQEDPPQRYLGAHDYALALQEADQSRRRGLSIA
jgi:hypothetical protein